MNRTTYLPPAALALALAASPVMAMTDSSALPPEQHQGKVTYVTGGIGSDESAAMRRAESRYPLTLEFVEHAKPRAEYLAAVAVTIADAKGSTELSTTSDGPFLLARLPAGKYTVRAEHDGKTELRHVTVARNAQRKVVFAW